MSKNDKKLSAKDYKLEYFKILNSKERLENLVIERLKFLCKEHPDAEINLEIPTAKDLYNQIHKYTPILQIDFIGLIEKYLHEKYSKIKQCTINFNKN